MDGIRTKTLATLPKQPLPSQTELVGPVFVTIWLFVTALFTFIIWRALTKPKPASQEFKTILYGTGFLTLWYFIIVVDRWIHYDGRAVGYGYILLIPIWEFFYVGSTIFILWGTYTIVWKELRDRFSGLTRTHQIAWWFVGNFALFILCMVSLFYVILFIALASIWLKFSSLNAIDDVATKRNGFEIAMHAFFFVFSLITSGAAAVAFWGAREVDGKTGQTRTTLLVATFLLLGRSLSQFAIALRANRPDVTRQDTQLARDISYGLLTVLYLVVISYFAFSTTNEYNREGRDAQSIQSDIRKHILTKLNNDTREGRHMSPDFETLYQDAGMNLEKILDSGPLSTTSSLDRDHKRRVAQKYLEQLKADYGELNPKEGRDMSVVDSRPGSVASVFSRKVTPSGRKVTPSGRKVTPSGRRTTSNPNIRGSEARNSPTPSHNLRKKSQEMLARFSPRVHDTVEEERERI